MVGRNVAPFRIDAAGLNQNHIYAEGLQLHAQGIAQSLHRILGHVIPAAERQHHPADHRAHIHNAAEAVLPHGRKHQLGEARQAEDIHLQLPAGLLHGNILDGAEVTVAGIVHQHVYTAFRRQDIGHAGLHGRFGGNVQAQGRNAVFPQRLHAFYPAGAAVHFMAFLCQQDGTFVADAAAGTCNKNYHRLALSNCNSG